MLRATDWYGLLLERWDDAAGLRELLRMGEDACCIVPHEEQKLIITRIYELERAAESRSQR